MSKLPNSNSDTSEDTGMRSTEDRPPSTPRWVKATGIIVIVLVLLFVIMKLTGIGGNHGPGRHGSGNHGTGGDPAEQTEQQKTPGEHPPPEGGHTPPRGDH